MLWTIIKETITCSERARLIAAAIGSYTWSHHFHYERKKEIDVSFFFHLFYELTFWFLFFHSWKMMERSPWYRWPSKRKIVPARTSFSWARSHDYHSFSLLSYVLACLLCVSQHIKGKKSCEGDDAFTCPWTHSRFLERKIEFLAFSWSVCRRWRSGRKEFIFLQERARECVLAVAKPRMMEDRFRSFIFFWGSDFFPSFLPPGFPFINFVFSSSFKKIKYLKRKGKEFLIIIIISCLLWLLFFLLFERAKDWDKK